LVAVVRSEPGLEEHAASYNSSGYSSVSQFLAETKGFDLRLFEPNSACSIDSGVIECTQKERREGKRGLLFSLLQSIGRKPIDYFEFGVMNCNTFNRVIEWTPSREARFYGFDTFQGLPEPWVRELRHGVGLGRRAGDLKAVHAPAVYDRRATLFKGLFQDSLPEALQLAFPNGRQLERPTFVNIDSDLYSAALFALTSMHPLLRSGDYVYFDEFFDALNEFSAFNDYIRAYATKSWFVPVARAYDGMLFRVELPPQPSTEQLNKRTTSFLDRMKAHLRTRISLRKPYNPGRDRKGEAT
jgi:hypothetical protein